MLIRPHFGLLYFSGVGMYDEALTALVVNPETEADLVPDVPHALPSPSPLPSKSPPICPFSWLVVEVLVQYCFY